MADQTVGFAVAGLGNIGARHVANLVSGEVPGAALVAVAASSGVPSGMELPDGVAVTRSVDALVRQAGVQAVLLATPTHQHVDQGLQVLAAGHHLLVEKPLAICTRDARHLLAAAARNQICGVVLNQRLDPAYATIHRILAAGELGPVRRVSWTMTHWYRPDIYFRVSPWRGTWRGEGGGLLLNQCIHNLDVLQWLIGMPARVRAHAGFGRFHAIEVEDEVSAYLEWESGATGTIVASTGEAPGRNQLDIVGDAGTLEYDGASIRLTQMEPAVSAHCRDTREMFGMPATSTSTVEIPAAVNQHALLLGNFAAAICGTATLQFAATEGIHSLELANAMLYSAWEEKTVELPLDDAAYARALDLRVAGSTLREPEQLEVDIDIEKSFR